jgi:hypothetical protein
MPSAHNLPGVRTELPAPLQAHLTMRCVRRGAQHQRNQRRRVALCDTTNGAITRDTTRAGRYRVSDHSDRAAISLGQSGAEAASCWATS